MKAVVALDLSLTSTGVARFWKDGKEVDTRAWTFPTDSKQELALRVSALLERVMGLVDPEDVVAVEDYAYGISPKQSNLTTLAEIGGLVKYACWRRTGCWPLAISSGTMKKWASGSGATKKAQLPLIVFKRLGVEFDSDDALDAWILGDLVWHLLAEPDCWRRELLKYERDVLNEVAKKKGSVLQALAEKIR